MRLLGMDEAGRGCVLGPLVVGAFLSDLPGAPPAAPLSSPEARADLLARQQPLRDAGAADSKQLSAAKRAAAQLRLSALGHAHLRRVEAAEIDEGNLNELEFRAFIDLARAHQPDIALLDAPVHPKLIPALQARLARETGVARWIIEPKADHTWPVVGAASISAKLCRDQAIEDIDAPLPVGSGYPSDPLTRALLRHLLSTDQPLPAWVRSRWGTIRELKQQSLFG